MRLIDGRAIFLAALLGLLPLASVADADPEDAARRAALAWLALVDAGDFESSWKSASSLIQDAVSASELEASITAARGLFGRFISREVVSATFARSLPGVPDGEYVVIEYRSVYEKKQEAVETVTPMVEDGEWKVSGYYIR